MMKRAETDPIENIPAHHMIASGKDVMAVQVFSFTAVFTFISGQLFDHVRPVFVSRFVDPAWAFLELFVPCAALTIATDASLLT